MSRIIRRIARWSFDNPSVSVEAETAIVSESDQPRGVVYGSNDEMLSAIADWSAEENAEVSVEVGSEVLISLV